MPILPEHTKELKDVQYSDLRSIGKAREGGACTAAAFLKEFVEEDVEWSHLDIAGPAMTSRPYGHHGTGGTGFGAALLLQYLSNRQ